MNFFKKITYDKKMREIARILHLRIFFRNLYFTLAKPRGGVLEVIVNGINAKFLVKTPGELRILESMGGSGSGEKVILERLMSNIRPGDIFYDIGGHVGLYTIFMSKAIREKGNVVTFEPNSQNNDHLQENLKINKIENVKVFKKALGNINSFLNIEPGEDGGNFSLLKTGESDQSEKVEIVRGDDFINKEGLQKPNIIKIDVEGYEYEVIKGLYKTISNSNCRILCCEVHKTLLPRDINPDDIINMLKSLGFSKIENHLRDKEFHILAYKK